MRAVWLRAVSGSDAMILTLTSPRSKEPSRNETLSFVSSLHSHYSVGTDPLQILSGNCFLSIVCKEFIWCLYIPDKSSESANRRHKHLGGESHWGWLGAFRGQCWRWVMLPAVLQFVPQVVAGVRCQVQHITSGCSEENPTRRCLKASQHYMLFARCVAEIAIIY